MAVAYITEAHLEGLDLPLPSGLTVGDLMIGAVIQKNGHSCSVAGWTEVADVNSGGTNPVSCAVFWRIYEAGDPSSWTVHNDTGGLTDVHTATFAFSGANPIVPIETFSSNTDHGNPIIWPSITTVNTMIVGFAGGIWDPSWNPADHTTPSIDQKWHGLYVSSGNCSSVGWINTVAPGATGDYSFTLNSAGPTNGYGSVLLAINPAASCVEAPSLHIPYKDRLMEVQLEEDDEGILEPTVDSMALAVSHNFDNLKTIERWAIAFLQVAAWPTKYLLLIPNKDTRDLSPDPSAEHFKAIERWANLIAPTPECQLFIPFKFVLNDYARGTITFPVAQAQEFENYKAIERWAWRFTMGECCADPDGEPPFG